MSTKIITYLILLHQKRNYNISNLYMELHIDKDGLFKNKNKSVITLRGVNIVNKMHPYTAEDI